MRPRERVMLALDHKEPDRIPVDLGGFVFATAHNIQALVPPKKVVTAFETALEYGTY